MFINMDFCLEIFSVYSRIKISFFIHLSLSIPVNNKQLVNEFKGDDIVGPIIAKFHHISFRTEMLKLISGEFISESIKSNIDVINELNIHRLKLGNLNYDPCPGMNPIVNASRTFHEKLADKCKLHCTR